MNLTSQNTDLQQVQQVLRSILTEIETRKVSGEPVARVATPEKHPIAAHKLPLTNAAGNVEPPLPTTEAESE